VAQDFKPGVVDFGGFVELSYVFDLDVWIILKLEVVNPLSIRIETLRRREKAPIWFLLIIQGELLQVLYVGLYGRHWGVAEG
jgi:hypothetical protein